MLHLPVPAEKPVSVNVRDWHDRKAAKEQYEAQLSVALPGEWVPPPQILAPSGGQRGGRPVNSSGAVRGMKAGYKSNRRRAGQGVLRRDVQLSSKLAIISRLHERVLVAGSVADVPLPARRAEEQYSGFPWPVMVKWYSCRQQMGEQFLKMKLGKCGLNPVGSSFPKWCRRSTSLGSRLQQSERKDTYQTPVLKKLRNWFEGQRSQGITVYPAVLRDRYVKYLEQATVEQKTQLLELQGEVEQLQSRGQQLSPDALSQYSAQIQQCQKFRDQLQHRLTVMQSSVELKKGKYWKSVQVAVGAQFRSVQRVTQLTQEQVRSRVSLTWQGFDRAQYLAVSGSDEELIEFTQSPQQWRRQLPQTVWVLWDHAPVWLKPSGSQRVLHSEPEMASKKQRQKSSRQAQNAVHETVTQITAASETVTESQQQQRDQPVQTVAPGSGADQKFRLTLIMFQSLEQWFNYSQTPVGRGEIRSQRDSSRAPLQSILIVKSSQHCRQYGLGVTLPVRTPLSRPPQNPGFNPWGFSPPAGGL